MELAAHPPRLIGSQWRIYVGFAGLFAFGLVLVWLFRRPPAPAPATTYAMALQIVVCGLLAITSDRAPRRWLSELRLILLASLGSLAAFAGYFFGPNSGVAGYIGVALAFAGLRAGEVDRSSRIEGWVVYVTVAGGQATVITLVLVGVLSDSSLATVFVRDSPPHHHAANHVAIQVVYFACFIAGVLLQRRYRRLVGEYDELVRSTSLKEALIAEAKADYQHALRVAGDGLFSGQRVGEVQLGRVLRREGRREIYEVVDGDRGATSAVAMSTTGVIVDTKQITKLIETGGGTEPDATGSSAVVDELADDADAAAADTAPPERVERHDSSTSSTPMPDLATTTTHVLRAAYLQKIAGLYAWVAMLCVGGGSLLTMIAWDRRVLVFALTCIALILIAAAVHWRLNRNRTDRLVDWPVILMSGLSLGPGAVFGIHSGYTVVVVSIMFVAGAFRSDRGNLLVPLAAMTTHAVYFTLQFTGVLPDLGYAPLRFAGAPWWEPLAYHVLVQVTFLGPFLAGRFVDRRHAELRLRVAEAAHEAAQKSALLVAARRDLDRLLSQQNEGLFTGQEIGPYRVGPLLGRGGMGEVYEARSLADDRRVALKVIRRERLGDPRTLKMFLDERDAVSRVRSGYVANVIDAAMPEHAMPYIAMEYIDGSSLSTLLQSAGRLALDQTRVLVDHICRGLADVHSAGVLHRDVKPQNIMRTKRDNHDRWMLIDFGIARLAGAGRESLIVGTLAYMAPEQARGDEVDARADLYSLCLVIYRVLTGRPAFSDSPRLDAKQLKRLPPDPGYFVPLPLDVALVLRIGLAPDRNDRFATATELHTAFEAACAQRLPAVTRERARRLLEQELCRARWNRRRDAPARGAYHRMVTDEESGTWVKRRDDGDTLHVRTCRLEVVSGPDRGMSRVFETPSIVIGRAQADFQLDDRRVSALHAEIRLETGGFRLRDLGSKNGTHVGGLRVVDAYILANTSIAIGESIVRFSPLPISVELPLSNASRLGGLVGSSPVMRRLYEVVEQLAATETTVLISGETGTGKELVARALHDYSPRRQGPFVILDCGALPAQLIEDLVFGHEDGAFPAAAAARAGVFEAARGGTLFLDEVGEIPIELQPKLLRAIETKQVRRVGGIDAIDCDVRIVAATNRDLAAEVNRDAFRADLFFRLAVARVHVPPLREHREDIDELVAHFLVELGAAAVPAGFGEWARRQTWPGNVRELRGALEQTLALSQHPEMLAQHLAPQPASLSIDVSIPFKEAKRQLVDELERRYITELLEAHGGNVSAAARAADLDRVTIYKMLYRAGLRDRT